MNKIKPEELSGKEDTMQISWDLAYHGNLDIAYSHIHQIFTASKKSKKWVHNPPLQLIFSLSGYTQFEQEVAYFRRQEY